MAAAPKVNSGSSVLRFGQAWENEKAAASVVANDSGAAPRRKKLPRTFERKPRPWLQPILELPEHSSERMLSMRRDELNLSRADASRLLRVARNTIWDWESGYRSAPFSAFLALRLIAEGNPHHEIQAPLPAEVPAVQDLSDLPLQGRFVSRRQLAYDLQQRMRKFSAVYNAGCLLRDSWHGAALHRQACAWRFAHALAIELRQTHDHEALIYAAAESLYCSPLGVPWEP